MPHPISVLRRAPRPLRSARTFATVVVALLVASFAAPLAEATAAPGDLLRDRPYVPLFTDARDCRQIIQTNELTGAALDQRLAEIGRWYRHVHAEGSNSFTLAGVCQGRSSTTLAQKLSARGIWASQYRNGSYVSQSSRSAPLNFEEAADLERTAPLAIGTYWAGDADSNWRKRDVSSPAARLAEPIDGRTTTIRITSAEAHRPDGAPRTWPFVDSRGQGRNAGAYSTSTRDFVSWIRVDDELMHVVGAPQLSGGVVTLTVRRGLWGTAARSHQEDTRVLSPVYIGSKDAHHSDSNLSGSPVRNDPDYPLRYAVRFWRADGYRWIARQITRSLGSGLSGYDTIWLDVSSCYDYNNSDPYGNQVRAWDDRDGASFTRDGYGTAQRAKLAGLRNALPGVRFTMNNLGGNTDDCNRSLIQAADGGVLENWMKPDGSWPLNWSDQMRFHIDIQSANLPGIYWVRPERAFRGDEDAYLRFAYGSLLLGYRPSATRFQFGGPFDLSKPPDLLLWDWGRPLTTPGNVEDVRVAGTPLYRREFDNGIVVVNPGGSAASVSLGGTYYDVVRRTSSGEPRAVTSITVDRKDAAFLVRGPGSPGGPAPGPPPPPPPSDGDAPTVTVTTPGYDAVVAAGTVRIAGDTADDQRVSRVALSVLDRDTGQYLQPDGRWGAWTELPATLGDNATRWRIDLPLPAGRRLGVEVVAEDAAGNEGRVWHRFETGGGGAPPPGGGGIVPAVEITAPDYGTTVTTQRVTIAGQASDDRGVAEVTVAIADVSRWVWLQPDGTWGDYAAFSVPVGADGRWSISVRPTDGRQQLGILGYAFDRDGNRSEQDWVRFDHRP